MPAIVQGVKCRNAALFFGRAIVSYGHIFLNTQKNSAPNGGINTSKLITITTEKAK
jgi:hypothetical protein